MMNDTDRAKELRTAASRIDRYGQLSSEGRAVVTGLLYGIAAIQHQRMGGPEEEDLTRFMCLMARAYQAHTNFDLVKVIANIEAETGQRLDLWPSYAGQPDTDFTERRAMRAMIEGVHSKGE